MTKDGFSASGRSILEILWEELDGVLDLLRAEGEPEFHELFGDYLVNPTIENMDIAVEEILYWAELRGRAQGVTYAIAVLSDPYNKNVEAVKQTAMSRWESRNPDSD